MVCSFVLIYFDSHQLCIQWKQTVFNFRLLIERYAQFWFFRKGWEKSFSTTFYVWFFKNNVSHLILYSINWQNFIASLPFFLEILSNMCIAIVCFPGFDVINFENNLIFLIKPFLYMTRKSRQKLKYLENQKSFQGEIKSFAIIFKRFSVSKNFLRPETEPLIKF